MLRAKFYGLIFAALLAAGAVSAERELKADSSEDQSIEALEKRIAQNPKDLELRYALGIAYNEKAMQDDETALDHAINIFQAIVKEDPSSVKAQAMLGSCTVMKAQHVSIFDKLDYVEKGYGILDQVVIENPSDPDLRLIRGVNAARSPGFLGRSDIAETDFDWLLADLKKADNHYDDNYRRTIYFYVGDWYLEQRDSRCVELLLKASTTPGAPRLTDSINADLKKAKKRFPSTYSSLEKK